MTEANRLYKDRVFKFIFGNPENKEWTLSLYNAVNGSNYSNPDDIQFNTIEDAVYMSMKNDVSFIILDEMNLWEHQSSFNPNMPMRLSSLQQAGIISSAESFNVYRNRIVSVFTTELRSNRSSKY